MSNDEIRAAVEHFAASMRADPDLRDKILRIARNCADARYEPPERWLARALLHLHEENAELRRALDRAAESIERACEHLAPESCYSTGPKTGDPIRDLVECPGCAALEVAKDIRRLLAGDAREVQDAAE